MFEAGDNPARAPFVGRSAEVERVLAVLDRAGDGSPAAVVVAGETGVGKTRFLHECAAAARDRGARALVGTCVASEGGGPPYGAVADALRSFLRTDGPGGPRDDERAVLTELAHAVRGLTDAGHEADRPSPARVYDLLLAALTAVAAHTPLLLAVDDLQWADEATRDAVAFLAANLTGDRVVTVVAYRSDGVDRAHPLRRFLGDVAAKAGIDRVDLRRLRREELAEVLAATGGIDHDRFESLWSRSAGNPLFAQELAAAAGDEDGIPPSLHDLLLGRLCALSPVAQRVLRAAAVAGGAVPHDLLVAVAGLDEAEVREGLREALTAGALTGDAAGDCYGFHHPLLAEVARADLLPSELRELHAAYARELTGRPELATDEAGPAPELALHWYAAQELEAALAASLAAGTALVAAHRFADARPHFECAVELWDRVPDPEATAGARLADVLASAARAADLAGDHEAAVAHVLAAVDAVDETGDPATAAMLHTRLGGYLSRSGDDGAALAAHDRAVDLVPAEPTAERAHVVAGRAAALLVAGRHAEARDDAEAALEVARRSGAAREEGIAKGVLGVALASLGQPEEGLDLVRASVAAAADAGDPEDVGAAWLHLVSVLADPLDRPDEVVAAALEGVARSEALGLRRCYPVRLQVQAANALFASGRWDEAEVLLERAAAELPTGVAAADLALARAALWTELGRFDDARRAVDDAAALLHRSGDPGQQAGLSIAAASLAVWQHRIDDARRIVATGLERAALAPPASTAALVAVGLGAEADRADVARARHDDEASEDAVRRARYLLLRARRLLRSTPPPNRTLRALVAGCEAAMSRVRGRSEPSLWAEVAGRSADGKRPLAAAYARWREAEAVLARRTAPGEATESLTEAAAAADRLGAVPLRREIGALAGRARIRLDGAAEDPAPAGWPADALDVTPREQQVLDLLVQGATNREIGESLFISQKTASVHVSNILAKLGVSTRVQAAAVADRARVQGA